MKSRYFLLKNWLYEVMQEKDEKKLTAKLLIGEFKKDCIPAMGELLKVELTLLKLKGAIKNG